jgi:hypothetical protein
MRIALWYLIGAAAMTSASISSASAASPPAVAAADADPCSHFSWDVSHELAVMKQSANPVVAATRAGSASPLLEVDKPYEIKLAPQATVSYIVKPGKPTLDDSAQGGLVRFRLAKPGLYRVSLTSGHWIDVVLGDHLVKSKDFSGSRGCARPHKIVEFVLPANEELTLQLSGSTDSAVTVAITPAGGAPAAG